MATSHSGAPRANSFQYKVGGRRTLSALPDVDLGAAIPLPAAAAVTAKLPLGLKRPRDGGHGGALPQISSAAAQEAAARPAMKKGRTAGACVISLRLRCPFPPKRRRARPKGRTCRNHVFQTRSFFLWCAEKHEFEHVDYSAAVKAALGSGGTIRGGGAERERDKLRRLVQEVMQAALLHVEATRGREYPQAVSVGELSIAARECCQHRPSSACATPAIMVALEFHVCSVPSLHACLLACCAVRSTVDQFLSGALETLTLQPTGAGGAASAAAGSSGGAGAAAGAGAGVGSAIVGRSYSRTNPKNVENATRLAQLQALNAGLSGELDDWRECIQRYGSASSSAGGAGAGAGAGGISGGPPTSGTSLFALAEGSGVFDDDGDDGEGGEDDVDAGVLARLGIAPSSSSSSSSASAGAGAGASAAVSAVPDHHPDGLARLLRRGTDAARDAVSGHMRRQTDS